jgi:hypothetical protein
VIKTNFKFLTTILIAIALFANITLAALGLGIPNAFYGSVTWNGQPAPDGTTVVAKMSGVQVASTTTSGGNYGYPIGSFYIDDPSNDRTGKTINFFVNNVDTGQTGIFANGAITQLNLSATGPTGGTPSGPGGGGPSGPSGGTPVTQTNQTPTQTTQQQGCQEKWVCSSWSECKDGIQTRTCTDENNCGTRNNEPFNSQPCSAAERKEAEEKEAQAAAVTGFFLGVGMTDWLIAIIAGIVIAIIVIFLAKRRGSKK